MNMAELIKNRRTELGLSLRQLSEKTELSHSHIRDIENGKYSLSIENAVKIAKVLELNVQEIIILAYQSLLNQTLFELIDSCNKNNVRIPFDTWVKSNLPMQPLGADETKINDAAFIIATALYKEPNKDAVKTKIEFMETIASPYYDHDVISLVQKTLDPLSIVCKLLGTEKAKDIVNKFKAAMNGEIQRLIENEEAKS